MDVEVLYTTRKLTFALPVLRYDLSVAVCDLSAGCSETVAFKVSL